MRNPSRFRRLAAVAAAVATLAIGATRGRADVVPEEDKGEAPCTAPGQTCTFEVEGDQGTCVAVTCTKQVRNHRNGVMTPVAVPCFECRQGVAGKSTSPPKSSGCAAAPERGDTGTLAVMTSILVMAGLMLKAARRRRPKGDTTAILD